MLKLPPRRSIQCILPPHIVTHLAAHGSEDLRRLALQFLEMDHSLRAARTTFSLMGGLRISHPTTAAAPVQKRRTIYDEAHSQALPGQVVRQEGQPASADRAVNQAYDGLVFGSLVKQFAAR